jgi:hypothetical protein
MVQFRIGAALCLLVAGSLLAGCEFSVSTANIKEATLSRGVGEGTVPVDPTTTFTTADKEIHAIVVLGNAPSDTKVRAFWRTKGGEKLDMTDIDAGGGRDNIDFSISMPSGLPPGDYAVDIYVNPKERATDQKPDQTLEFKVTA